MTRSSCCVVSLENDSPSQLDKRKVQFVIAREGSFKICEKGIPLRHFIQTVQQFLLVFGTNFFPLTFFVFDVSIAVARLMKRRDPSSDRQVKHREV